MKNSRLGKSGPVCPPSAVPQNPMSMKAHQLFRVCCPALYPPGSSQTKIPPGAPLPNKGVAPEAGPGLGASGT